MEAAIIVKCIAYILRLWEGKCMRLTQSVSQGMGVEIVAYSGLGHYASPSMISHAPYTVLGHVTWQYYLWQEIYASLDTKWISHSIHI